MDEQVSADIPSAREEMIKSIMTSAPDRVQSQAGRGLFLLSGPNFIKIYDDGPCFAIKTKKSIYVSSTLTSSFMLLQLVHFKC